MDIREEEIQNHETKPTVMNTSIDVTYSFDFTLQKLYGARNCKTKLTFPPLFGLCRCNCVTDPIYCCSLCFFKGEMSDSNNHVQYRTLNNRAALGDVIRTGDIEHI